MSLPYVPLASTVIGRNGPMVAYTTADPDVALVTDATGHERMMRLAVLVKFGWIFRADDDPLVAAGTSEGARKAWDVRGRLNSGTKHYWALSEGALAIAEQAHAIVNDDVDEHSGAQWRDMATEIMDAIDAQPARPAKLFSGQTAMSAPEVGEEVVLPILSVSPSLDLAQAYAGKQAGMADPRGTPDDQLLWSQMRPEIRDMIGRGMERKVSSAADESPRLIYHFADTRSVPVRDNERLVSGRYTVTAVRQGDPIPDAWVYDFELHDVRQKRYVEVDLQYNGPARPQ